MGKSNIIVVIFIIWGGFWFSCIKIYNVFWYFNYIIVIDISNIIEVVVISIDVSLSRDIIIIDGNCFIVVVIVWLCIGVVESMVGRKVVSVFDEIVFFEYCWGVIIGFLCEDKIIVVGWI